MRDLPGVINISDDILVYGSNQEEHNIGPEACLQRLCDANLTLNRHVPIQLVTSSLHNAIAPDPQKINSI